MAIVTSTVVKAYCGISDADYTSYGTYIHTGIEAFVKSPLGGNQPFESTTYTNELYDGSGNCILRLNAVPVISVKYIATSVDDVIQIKNTMTDASLASVVVDSTNITLTVEGGSGEGSDTLDKATYSTCTLLVDAINAQSANGWSAQIVDSDYNSLKTAYMQDQQLECAQDEGVAQSWQYLSLAHNFASGFRVNKDTGEIYHSGGFSKGFQNICVTYTAGYATVPADITFFILDTVKFFWDRKSNDMENISKWQVGDWAITYAEMKESGVLSSQVIAMLDQYRDKNIRI